VRQSIGGLAGLLAMIGLWMHTQSQPAAENATSQTSASAGVKGKTAKKADDPEPPEGPWVATQAFFHSNSDKYDRARLIEPASADLSAKELRQFLGLPDRTSPSGVEMWSIVATVADPLHSRQSLFLDNQLESIERAFQAAGWDFAGQWLPWIDHVDATETDIGSRRKQRSLQREEETFPGIMIFRSTREGSAKSWSFKNRALFVLLVPETPTTGIYGPAFFAAMNIAKALLPSMAMDGASLVRRV
jgi:hypothetical protein